MRGQGDLERAEHMQQSASDKNVSKPRKTTTTTEREKKCTLVLPASDSPSGVVVLRLGPLPCNWGPKSWFRIIHPRNLSQSLQPAGLVRLIYRARAAAYLIHELRGWVFGGRRGRCIINTPARFEFWEIIFLAYITPAPLSLEHPTSVYLARTNYAEPFIPDFSLRETQLQKSKNSCITNGQPTWEKISRMGNSSASWFASLSVWLRLSSRIPDNDFCSSCSGSVQLI